MTKPGIAASRASLAINQDQPELQILAGSWLSDREQAEFAARRPASLVGLITAKQALTQFFAPFGELDPREFRISHEDGGKPVLLSLPTAILAAGYQLEWCDISISHSRLSAMALVAGVDPVQWMERS